LDVVKGMAEAALFLSTFAEKGKKGQDDYDDAHSICSTGTYTSMGNGQEELIDSQTEVFSLAIDDTYESRCA
jgi:hypothetical protein